MTIHGLKLAAGRETAAHYPGAVSGPRVPGGVVHKLPADLRRALIANATALDAWKARVTEPERAIDLLPGEMSDFMSRSSDRLRSPGEGPRQARPTTPGVHPCRSTCSSSTTAAPRS